jgi:hypothetical protein
MKKASSKSDLQKLAGKAPCSMVEATLIATSIATLIAKLIATIIATR